MKKWAFILTLGLGLMACKDDSADTLAKKVKKNAATENSTDTLAKKVEKNTATENTMAQDAASNELSITAQTFGGVSMRTLEQTQGKADQETLAQCLVRQEKEAHEKGLFPKNLSCQKGQNTVSSQDLETWRTYCNDIFYTKCGADPVILQEKISQNFPKLNENTSGLTDLRKCMIQKEKERKNQGTMPSRLQCGQVVIGHNDMMSQAQICEEILEECDPSLKDFDSSTFVQDTKGKNIKVDFSEQNPSCAPNNRGQYNEDCSLVKTSTGQVWKLTAFQMCLNRKNVERQSGVFKVGSKKLDCGMQVSRFEEQQILEKECDIITNECKQEVPNYQNERMEEIK